MSRAVDYYNKYSMEQLVEMQTKVQDDPRNKNTKGGIWLYKPSANKRLDDIARAITWHIQEDKKEKNDGA